MRRALSRRWRESWETTLFGGGLGRRILLWFLVLSLVPLLVSNTVGYQVTRRIIEGQTRRYLRALTEFQAQQVAAEVEQHQLYLDAVVAGNTYLAQSVPAAAAAVREGSRRADVVTALHEHLDRKLTELHTLTELFVLDTTGRVIAATRHSRVGEDWSTSELYLSGRNRRYFGEGWGTHDGRVIPLYRLAVPVRDDELNWVGILGASVEFDRVQAFLGIPPHIAENVHAYIADGEGRPLFLSHQHAPIDYGAPLPSPLIAQPAGSIARYANYEGVEVVGTSVAIPGIGWLYISEVPVASAFGQLRSLALLAAALESVFALLLVAIVWIVARSIVGPLRRLVTAAERIRQGELGVEVGIERHDELGDLGSTFDQMSRELRASARQIQEMHDDEMRRAAQLASVGELASGIAHEIKNPLVGVASGIELLGGQVKNDAQSEAILAQIRAQVDRMEAAIQDLLRYARPMEPCLAWIDPGKLVDRVVALVRAQAEAARVHVGKRQDEPAPNIQVDPELLTQALVNLALNGIQAMESGGLLQLSVESREGYVRISVSDTGSGISEDRFEEIFKPFYTTKHQGTGLGLAITRGIIERHGGHIEVASEPGKGSTFTLVISVGSQTAVAR